MAKDRGQSPGSVARAQRIREQIDRLKEKQTEAGSDTGETSPRAGAQPPSLREIIHDRMDKLDKKKIRALSSWWEEAHSVSRKHSLGETVDGTILGINSRKIVFRLHATFARVYMMMAARR